MKKLYFIALFATLNLMAYSQEFETVVDPVNLDKIILQAKAQTEDIPSRGLDSTKTLKQVIDLIRVNYEELEAIENGLVKRRKALSSLKKIMKNIDPDTSFNKYAKDQLFDPWVDEYRMFIDQVDTFGIVIEKTASGNTRIRETGLSASQARKYNVIPYTSQSMEVRNITVGSKEYDVVLYQSKTNEKVYKTLPKSIDPVHPEWIIPKIKIRRKK